MKTAISLMIWAVVAIVHADAYSVSGSTYTTNGSASDVQAAVNAAPAGSTVIIPNGSYSWSSGVVCAKAITIRGATVGGVTITDNYAGSVVSLTPQSSGNVAFANVIFTQGSVGTKNAQHYIEVQYAPGSQPYLIHDCRFLSTGGILSQILTGQNGGVIWNCHFDGGNTGIDISSVDEGIQFKNPTVDIWQSISTMGMAGDPNGRLNTYVEDCTFNDFYTEATDMDDGSRTVIRHCTFTNSACVSHGADTSPYGNRHWEYYDSKWVYPWGTFDSNAPNVGSPICMRGGTGVITGNSFTPMNTQNWGTGRNSICWLSDALTARGYNQYPIPRADGQSWSGGAGSYSYPQAPEMGSGYITEPIYVWANTTDNTYQTGSADSYGYINPDSTHLTSDWIKPNRDFFFDNGAKPGWSRFTYPHPLRSTTPLPTRSPTPPPNSAPQAPQNLRVVAP